MGRYKYSFARQPLPSLLRLESVECAVGGQLRGTQDRVRICFAIEKKRSRALKRWCGGDERLPRNYTHKIEYLRRLAELARTDPHAVLPPARHVLSMRETTTAYERLGRSFVVHLARANVYAAGAGRAGVRFGLFEQDGMSDFARGYSALPVELRDSMFAGLADYVVGNLLVWVRRKSGLSASFLDLFFVLFVIVFFSNHTSDSIASAHRSNCQVALPHRLCYVFSGTPAGLFSVY